MTKPKLATDERRGLGPSPRPSATDGSSVDAGAGPTLQLTARWGGKRWHRRVDIRGVVFVAPGGVMRSADIHIKGEESFVYEILLPRGRSIRRVGIPTIEEAVEEAERVARKLLEMFVEAP